MDMAYCVILTDLALIGHGARLTSHLEVTAKDYPATLGGANLFFN